MSSSFSISPANVCLSISELPSDVAERVERAQVEDPETLRRILVYGMTRLTIFETLLSNGWASPRNGSE